MNTDPNTPITQDPNPTQPVETTVPLMPQDTPPSETPNVIVPNSSSGVPPWFYFIFGITLIVFFLVTTLLVLQITQKQPSSQGTVSVPQVTSAKLPTPTVIADPAVSKLNDTGNSDDLVSIETDIKNTDLDSWGKELSAVETEINSSL